MEAKALADNITTILSNRKAQDIEVIDVSEQTIVADYFIIASARSTTAVKALAGYVDEDMKKLGVPPLRSEGISASKWIAIDYGDVIVHIFLEETRNFYHLERLWTNGQNVTKIEE